MGARNNNSLYNTYLSNPHTISMGKALPPHVVAAIVTARHCYNQSWIEISRDLQVNPESARQAYERAKDHAGSDNILEILEQVYPKKS